MKSKSHNLFLIITFYLLVSNSAFCFRITKCGSGKMKEITTDTGNDSGGKSMVYFDRNKSPIRIGESESVELWCESDCWFSECTLEHDPNTKFGCNLPATRYEKTVTRETSYELFDEYKSHRCQFKIEKVFNCTGNIGKNFFFIKSILKFCVSSHNFTF